MLILNTDVFEEMLTGTGTTWYSYSEFNATIAAADQLAVFAYATNISNTSVVLNIGVDDSIDGRNWQVFTTPLISGTISVTAPAYQVRVGTAYPYTPASFSRFRIYLSGSSSAACRLKLSISGRTY